MSRRTLVVAGAVVWILMSFLCVRLNAAPIEHDLRTRALGSLEAAQLAAPPGLSISGRDVVLSGRVASAHYRARVEQVVSSVRGVSRVFNRLEIPAGGKTSPQAGPQR